jgi:hypothetical protein
MNVSKAKFLKYFIEGAVGLTVFVGLGRVLFFASYLLADRLNATKTVEFLLLSLAVFSAGAISCFTVCFIHKHLEVGPF